MTFLDSSDWAEPVSINIPSNWTDDVFNTWLRCLFAVLSAVKIEQAAVLNFSEYMQDLISFNKTNVVCGSMHSIEKTGIMRLQEACVCRAHFITGQFSFISPFCQITLKSLGCI